MEKRSKLAGIPSPNGSGVHETEVYSAMGMVDKLISADLMGEIYSYLTPHDLIICRSVNSSWKRESVRVMKLQPNSSLDVTVCKSLWPPAPKVSLRLHKLLTEMSEEERQSSLFQFSKFIIQEYRFLKLKKSLGPHIPLLKDFGWMIQHLDFTIRRISDISALFAYCPNLKTGRLDIEAKNWSEKNSILESGERENVKKSIFVDVRDYTRGSTRNRVIMKYLHSLDMSYNVQWNWAKFLMETTPNLTTLKCQDRTFCSSHMTYEYLGPLKDPHHFTKQLKMMKPGQLKVIHYDEFEHSGILTEFLKLDLLYLKAFIIPSTASEESSVVALEWMDLVKKYASTLESVFHRPYGFHLDRPRNDFPHLPRVTEASIPQNMVTTGNFFQKMPRLRKLKLYYSYNIYLNDANLDYCRQTGSQYERLAGGFMQGNEGLWRAGGDWLPHGNLDFLELGMGKDIFIPETFPHLFPKLYTLCLRVTDQSLVQLGDVIRVMKQHQWLREFSVKLFRDDSSSSPNMDEYNLRMAYVLMGISVHNMNDLPKTPIRNWTSVNFEKYFTECSLREMTGLHSFTMHNERGWIEVERKKVEKLLDLHCFAKMPGLRTKNVID